MYSKVPRAFLFLEDQKPSSKVRSFFFFFFLYHSAIQRVLDFFLCPTFRDRGQVGLQLQKRPREEGRFSKTRLMLTVWARQTTKSLKKKRNLFASRSKSVSTFFFCLFSLQFRKVRYIIRSGGWGEGSGKALRTLPFFCLVCGRE